MTAKRRPPRTNDPREIEAWRRGQDDDNFLKANRVPGADEDNVIVFSSDGDLKDSEIPIEDVLLRTVTRITSDYTLLATDGTIYADTDGGDIIVTLVGENGEKHRIINVGSSGNICTLTSANKINGSIDDEPIYDSESFDLQYQTDEGWF